MVDLWNKIIMSRTMIKKGDIFSVKINDNKKRYFQYIDNDFLQLNSDVIRVFEKEYFLDETPSLLDIKNDNVSFFAHCIVKLGVKMALWEKVGNIATEDISNVLFRDTNDYGSKPGEQVRLSHDWYVWKLGDVNFQKVGKLQDENRNSFIGIVFNPLGILELLRGNKYPIYYPDFE